MATDWDRRYREEFDEGSREVHDLVRRFSPYMPKGKPVIDIAMGAGRDLLFLAGEGFPAYGLEQSIEAIRLAGRAAQREHREISAVLGDALRLPFREACAGCVLVFRFLDREIMADLVRLVAPGGLLLYETYLKRQSAIDGRKNPAHALDDTELLGYFSSLELLFYEEGTFCAGGKKRALARYAGRKR